MKRVFAILAFLFTCSVISWADSPLTSTNFAQCYSDSPYVNMAEKVNGDMPTELLEFLYNPDAPIDERLAVINQLGWDCEGKTTGSEFISYIYSKNDFEFEMELVQSLDAGTLAVLAYSLAMSDYFNVSHAQDLAHFALEDNNGRSFCVAIVSALIDAQVYLSSDWEMVYKVVADVVEDETLNRDMRQDAIDVIMAYIDEYQPSDNENEEPIEESSSDIESDLELFARIVTFTQTELPEDWGDGRYLTALYIDDDYVCYQVLTDESKMTISLLQLLKNDGTNLAEDIIRRLNEATDPDNRYFSHYLFNSWMGIKLIYWSLHTLEKVTFTLSPDEVHLTLNEVIPY